MNSPSTPLVSFVIASYNHERYLAEAIESCLAQTYRNIEIVIVDDASTDTSWQIIERYASANPAIFRIERNPANRRQAYTMKRAVELARGDFIALLGSDDVALPHRVQAGLDILHSNPSIGAVLSRTEIIDENGQPIASSVEQLLDAHINDMRWQLLSGNCLNAPTALIRGDLLRKNPLNPIMRYVEDFDLWLRILDTHEIHRVDDIWTQYRQHGKNLSIFPTELSPLAPRYETAVCIIRALQRWPIGKLFHLKTPADSPERERELAQCHARLAEHCLNMDQVTFGRSYLYTPEAYRQLVIACEHDADNELANSLLPEVWRRLGDTGRAAGQAPTPLREWRDSMPVTLQPAAEPDKSTLAFRAWQSKRAFHEIDGQHLAHRMHRQWFIQPRFTVFIDASDATDAERSLNSLNDQLYGQWHAVLLGNSAVAPTERSSGAPAKAGLDNILDSLQRNTAEDWVIILPSGAELEPQALYAVADHINLKPHWQAIYADDVDSAGIPRFKPDFDSVLLAGNDYIGALAVAAPALHAMAPGVPHSAGLCHALAWQVASAIGEGSIGHISDVLFTVPQDRDSVPLSIVQACAEAYLSRNSTGTQAIPAPVAATQWLIPRLPTLPQVTLISVGGPPDLLLRNTDYPGLTVAGSIAATPGALAEAIQRSPNELILLCTTGLLPQDNDWLRTLVSTLVGWQAAIVAPAIVDSARQLENAGLALGMGGSLGGILPGTPYGEPGDALLRAILPHRCGAVEASCLLLSRQALMATGGLAGNYASLVGCIGDLCLQLGTQGQPIIWTPLALLQRVAEQRPANPENPVPFVERWLPRLAADPWWNRHLSLENGKALAETDLVARWHPERRDSLRVLALPLPPSGQAEYRVTAPLRALDDAGLVQATSACVPVSGHERSPTPVEITRLAPDVIYAQAVIDDVRLQGYVASARFNPGIFRIFSLDDRVSDIPQYNDSHQALPRHAVLERMALALTSSDRLIVSTRPLADLYAGQIDDIRIVPNRLEKALWADLASRPLPARKNDKPRVGWAGALQHAGDLAIIAPVIKELADEVDWVFFGMIPAGCEEFIAEFHPPVKPYSAYPAKLASLDLDLALAPLEINPFNEAKSNLRLLEYGILGWPVIASDIFPYREDNAPVCCVSNTVDAWLSAIREHLSDRQALCARGKSLERWVRERYLLEDHLDDWLAALTPGIKVQASRPKTSAPSPLFSTEDQQDIQGGWNPEQRDGKPRILAYSQTTLLHDYRAASPLRALRESGMARTLLFGKLGSNTVSCLSSKEIEQLAPDATYWNFIIDDLRLSEGLQRCARDFPDLRRVYALDDRIGDLPSTHPMAGMFPGKTLDTRIRQALSLCHRLIVTTPPLAELYGSLVDSVHIVPNRLEKVLWRNIMPPELREERRKLRVGWAGAQQHQGDLALIAQTVAELADEVDWIFFGMLPAGCEQHVREFHPAVPFIDYPAKLASLDLDIALAPLEINLFNEAKSNLRLLDYGYLGWPVICTDILPYRENAPPVIRIANTSSAWTQAIRDLAADAALRQALGTQLRQWVCTHYLLEDHLDEWKTALIG